MRLLSNRDLTIRQRRRPWKDPWKIDFASFHFFRDYPRSPSYLKRTEFRLEMKRGDRAQVQTEMVEFLCLPFPFSSKLKFWSFHVVVVQGRQRNVQKSVMHVQTRCLLIKPVAFLHRCVFLRSLLDHRWRQNVVKTKKWHTSRWRMYHCILTLFLRLLWSVTSCYWIDARQMESFRFIAELPRARRSPVAIALPEIRDKMALARAH